MLTPTHAWAGAPRHREPAVLSGMSEGEHCRKEEAAAKEQGEADTAKNRENAVPAMLVSAAAVCAAKKPIQKLLMD
jgi:hypothetical protein